MISDSEGIGESRKYYVLMPKKEIQLESADATLELAIDHYSTLIQGAEAN